MYQVQSWENYPLPTSVSFGVFEFVDEEQTLTMLQFSILQADNICFDIFYKIKFFKNMISEIFRVIHVFFLCGSCKVPWTLIIITAYIHYKYKNKMYVGISHVQNSTINIEHSVPQGNVSLLQLSRHSI